MMKSSRSILQLSSVAAFATLFILPCPLRAASAFPGERGANLDTYTREDIWEKEWPDGPRHFLGRFVKDVPRDELVAFALYTHQDGILKMTAQLFPLQPDEPRDVRLELKRNDAWEEVATARVAYPGWHAHFRLDDWDGTKDVPYRVRHGENSTFEGLIRKDPRGKDVIVVASLSCNSSQDRGGRDLIVANLKHQDPDLLFFAGDQSYDHREHTAAWLLFGRQFAEILRDRPVITIPDDHDIGQGNLWGEAGIVADSAAGDSGGYFYPPEYVKMVEDQQTWHLPDPVDPEPVAQGIGVYFTALNVGGVDFAILEDRKFKSGPKGKIPPMGPRPDHINQPGYDPAKIDLPALRLLGERQLKFLHEWGQDWTGAEIKAVLSQTALAGAVHKHGSFEDRLLADLDCNGWPQTGRQKALREIRRALAVHLCGDQHLSVVMQHGIDAFRDGPFGFTNPALVNTIYGRWWWPEDEQAGGGERIESPLPWTGDYLDGLYNKITMHAYANPGFKDMPEARRRAAEGDTVELADGYGLIRFNKKTRRITFESWPRLANVTRGDSEQFPGWPITVHMMDNDGRRRVGYLREIIIEGAPNAVVQVARESDGEILYTLRTEGNAFRPHVYDLDDTYTVRVGYGRADQKEFTGLKAAPAEAVESLNQTP